MRNKYILALTLILLACVSEAQVRFRVNTGAALLHADALLGTLVVSNYTAPVRGVLVLKVTELKRGLPVLQWRTNSILLAPGTNQFARFRTEMQSLFYENDLSRSVQASGTLVPASYEVCCSFAPDDKQLGLQPDDCYTIEVAPRLPLLLVSPADSICTKRPPFIWQGRKSISATVAYRVVCVPVGEKQSASEAMANGLAVIDQLLYRNQNQLPFPAGSAALEKGRRYAWQVTEVSENTILNSSEIYEFTVACDDLNVVRHQSYADVKSYETGRVYFFSNTIDFAFHNPYSEQPLNYAIIHMASGKHLASIPVLPMQRGLNQARLTVSSLKGIVPGDQYVLEIYNLSPTPHFFNFIIQSK